MTIVENYKERLLIKIIILHINIVLLIFFRDLSSNAIKALPQDLFARTSVIKLYV